MNGGLTTHAKETALSSARPRSCHWSLRTRFGIGGFQLFPESNHDGPCARGESGVLFATSSSGTATVQSWSSSNPSVATVSGGRVQGISYGISTVTAYFPDGSYASCQVHVALMGIDVSYYQGNINWTSVANSGLVDFAIIRTGYGGENWSTQKDTCFEQNYSGCVANNIPVGVYHFSYATTPEMAKKERNSASIFSTAASSTIRFSMILKRLRTAPWTPLRWPPLSRLSAAPLKPLAMM